MSCSLDTLEENESGTPSSPDYSSDFRSEFSCPFLQEALPDLPGWTGYITCAPSTPALTTLPTLTLTPPTEVLPVMDCHCVGTGLSTVQDGKPHESRAQTIWNTTMSLALPSMGWHTGGSSE